MNEMSQNELDELFQQSSSHNEFEYNPVAWDQLSNKLDSSDRKRKGWIFSAVFLFLIFIGISSWLFFGNENDISLVTETDSTIEIDKRKSIENTVDLSKKELLKTEKSTLKNNSEYDNIEYVKSIADIKKDEDTLANISVIIDENQDVDSANKKSENSVDENSKYVNKKSKGNSKAKIGGGESETKVTQVKRNDSSMGNAQYLNSISSHIEDVSVEGIVLLSTGSDGVLGDGNTYCFNELNKKDSIENLITLAEIQSLTHSIKPVNIKSDVKDNSKSIYISNPPIKWNFGLLIGSELTSVGRSGFSKPNLRFGLMTERKFKDNYGVSIGAIYNKIDYNSNGGNYKPPTGFWTRGIVPKDIEATCNILEIPLLLNYYPKGNFDNGFYGTIGVSSYLMLKEQYRYSYEETDNDLIQKWQGENENNHWFGIGQFSLGYQKILTSKMSLNLEPFVAVPLSGIGHGNVKLWNVGLNLKVNYRK